MLNRQILDPEVQQYIIAHSNGDVHKIAMAKSPFKGVEAKELANQIAARNKSAKKLPNWYNRDDIYYPSLLSVEQCSSETTAAYKAKLIKGDHVIDLTGGFGVDSHYFAKVAKAVTHYELNPELSAIAASNARAFEQHNTTFVAADGIVSLQNTRDHVDTIYIDPARRSSAGKVFMLKDCTPNVIAHLDLLLEKSKRLIIKTAPLLDITAGIKELGNVAEVHIVSVKNECKELLWVIEKDAGKNSADQQKTKIVAVTLNDTEKVFSYHKGDEETETALLNSTPSGYLYEPDVALLKSGAFNLIAKQYALQKLDQQTQLYAAETINPAFPGRIFKINHTISSGELKKEKSLKGNVIVRNYRDKAENLVKKYKIKPDNHQFLIFTSSKKDGYIVIDATIARHY